MKDTPLNVRKSFIFTINDKEQKNNEKYKLLMGCIPVIQSIQIETETELKITTYGLTNLNKDMMKPDVLFNTKTYGLVFQRKQKENGQEYYIMNSCARLKIFKNTNKINFINIDLLVSADNAGGAFAMFADIKNIVEDKNGKGEFITLNNIAYIDLTSLASFGTLSFYDKEGGLIQIASYNTKIKDIKQIFEKIKTNPNKYKTFKSLKQQYEINKTLEGENKKAEDKVLLKNMSDFWDNNIYRSYLSPQYYWILNTPLKQKLLKITPSFINLVRFAPKLIMEKQFNLKGYGIPMMLINY